MSEVDPSNGQQPASGPSEETGEAQGAWMLPPAPSVPAAPAKTIAHPASAIAAPGTPVQAEAESWKVPSVAERPPAGGLGPGGFRPTGPAEPATPEGREAPAASGALEPSAFSPSRYDLSVEPPTPTPLLPPPMAPPPAEPGPAADRWATVPPPPLHSSTETSDAASSSASVTGGFAFGGSAPADRSRVARTVGVVALVLALAAGSFAVLSSRNKASGQPVTVALRDGVTYRYRMYLNLDGSVSVADVTQPVRVTATELVAWKVLGHDRSGVATILATISASGVEANGHRVPGSRPQRVTLKVAPDGSILSADDVSLLSSGSAQASFPGSEQLTPLLPPHPVREGDSWKTSADEQLPYGLGSLHLSAVNYFVRRETVRGRDTMVITSNMRLPLDVRLDPAQLKDVGDARDFAFPDGSVPAVRMTGQTTVTSTSWFDPRLGELVKSFGSGHVDFVTTFDELPKGAPSTLEKGVRITADVSIQVVQLSGAPPASPPSPPPSSDASAKAALRQGLAAAKTFFARHGTYTGLTATAAARIDQHLAWRGEGTLRPGAVTIRTAKGRAVLLLSGSGGGTAWCVADVHGTTSYGRGAPSEPPACAGGW